MTHRTLRFLLPAMLAAAAALLTPAAAQRPSAPASASASATAPSPSPGGNPATQPASRDDAWLKRHDGFVARAREGHIDVLFLGDSITEGWAGPGKAAWQKHFAPLGAANFGLAADRCEHVLWRITHGELAGFDAKVIVLLIGTNNLKSGPIALTPEETAAGVAAILDQIRARQPQAKVLLLGILPRQPKYEWMPARIAATNHLLAKLADGQQAVFADYGARFLKADKSVDNALMPDSLHPNARGYDLWAQAMHPALEQLMGPSTPTRPTTGPATHPSATSPHDRRSAVPTTPLLPNPLRGLGFEPTTKG